MVIKDGDWTLLSHDEAMGRTVWTMFDGEKTHIRTDYRTDKIVSDNKAHLLDSAGQRWGGGRRVASIPLNIFYDKLSEANDQRDDKYMSRWLNDSDNAAFRTFSGGV